MKRIVVAASMTAALLSHAYAQSSPNWTHGQVPTAGQWNNAFASKQDALGFRPVNSAGDTMTGRLSLAASTTARASLNFAEGVAPSLPNNGDIWMTSAGFFLKFNGGVINLLGGVSVNNPGTGTLESLSPVQATTGANKAFATADLFYETRRSNSGSAMADTFPASSSPGLVNGARITVTNADASANDTITAGAGTTINGGATDVVGPSRSIQYVFDGPNLQWRRSLNTGSALLVTDTGTSGHKIPWLDGANTWSADQTIAKSNPGFQLRKSASGEAAVIYGMLNGTSRWALNIGSAAAESGSNAGSNFGVARYSDAGALLDYPISVARDTGIVTMHLGQIQDAGTYHNWGTTSGSSGYGCRDNGGAIECKDSSGAWRHVATESLTAAGDANYTILATDNYVYHSALSAARVDTLPAANAVKAGAIVTVQDLSGVATASNTITVQRAGADTINGATSVVAANAAYGGLDFVSDGVSKWSYGLGIGSTAGFGLTGSSTLAYDPTQIGWGPRNRLYNSGMAVDQRNAGAAVTLAPASGVTNYTVDRWYAYESAAGTGLTAQQIAVNTGGIHNALRIARANGSTNTNTTALAQVLQTGDNIDLQGRAVTLSFRARVGANWSAGTPTAAIATGTGADQSSASFAAGTWTGQATCGSATPTLTTSFAFYVVTCTIPSGATQIGVKLSWAWTGTAGAADYIDVTNIELVTGTYTAAQIVPESPGYSRTLALCQEFYETGTWTSTLISTGAGVSGIVWVSFHVKKRAAPTISKSGSSFSNATDGGTGTVNSDGFSNILNASAGGQFGGTFTFAADSEF